MWKFIVVILAKKRGNKTAKNANAKKKKQNKEPNKATMIFHNYLHHEAS